ncbi:MAG: RIP metalloprotease RseP [Anaerolineae bacterium]|nr:RIP metalloprotease RseP [Anaerolineae bacterium]
MSDFFMGVMSFVLVLVPLIIIHEFGHFIAAKLSRITVLEFGIGFPPRALTLFRRGDTIYTLNWLPIGGFVRPYGEDFVKPKTEEEMSYDRSEIEERGITNPKSVFQATPWQRLFFMAAGPGINFIAAWVLFVAMALTGQPYAKADVTVYDIMPDSPAAAAGLQEGDILLELNGEEIKSADRFNTSISDQANETVTLLVQRDGEPFELALTAQPVESSDVERVYIEGIMEDMPAVGKLEPEDVIIAVDGIEITSIDQLQDYTQAHEGVEMAVTVLRGNDKLTFSLAPRKNEGVVRIGITISAVKPAIIGLTAVNRDTDTFTEKLPFIDAIQTGSDNFVNFMTRLGEFVDELFSGEISPEAARPVSPVGIGQIGGPMLEQSLDDDVAWPILGFAAMISIALAVTNLLPIPGLDGGRILFVVIELIRGKPMEPEREGVIHFIGMLLLLGLVALTLINDIVNPIDIGGLK